MYKLIKEWIINHNRKKEEENAIECVVNVLSLNNEYELAKLYFFAQSSNLMNPSYFDKIIINYLEEIYSWNYLESLMSKYDFPIS